jgi:hypothetical protein
MGVSPFNVTIKSVWDKFYYLISVSINDVFNRRKRFNPCSQDSSVGIAMDYGLDGWGSIPGWGKKFLFTPQLPD